MGLQTVDQQRLQELRLLAAPRGSLCTIVTIIILILITIIIIIVVVVILRIIIIEIIINNSSNSGKKSNSSNNNNGNNDNRHKNHISLGRSLLWFEKCSGGVLKLSKSRCGGVAGSQSLGFRV